MVRMALACAIVIAVVGVTFLPFAAGGYDALAVPLASIAWGLGRIGLLLVPVGLLWLWASRTHVPGSVLPVWLRRVTLGACVLLALVLTLVAFASSSSLLLGAAVGSAAWLAIRVGRRMPSHPATTGAIFVLAPLAVLIAQTMLTEAITTRARARAIGNAAPLIAEIERHHERRGAYPESLFAIWGDYKPVVVGVERYHYERSGDAYNVIFQEPSLGFGVRRFVVYNPRDGQRVTVHEHDRLILDDAGRDADNAGHTIIQALPQPHWKLFLFLS